jgi:hypothetical protein
MNIVFDYLENDYNDKKLFDLYYLISTIKNSFKLEKYKDFILNFALLYTDLYESNLDFNLSIKKKIMIINIIRKLIELVGLDKFVFLDINKTEEYMKEIYIDMKKINEKIIIL